MDRVLPRPLVIPRDRWAVLLYLPLASMAAAALASGGRWWAVLFLVPAIFGPWGIVASGALLRLAYIGSGMSDNMLVVDAARERVLSGLSPYGVGYAESLPAGSPYPYGPLMLLDWIPLELAASFVILVLLRRRPLTLALFAGFPPLIYLASAGNTDMLPTVLLAGGLLFAGWPGAVLLGLSVAVKPYTAVFLPLASSVPIALTVAALGYLPALWWGGILETIRTQSGLQASAIRYLAAPLTLAAFRWPLLSLAAFAALSLSGERWSLGYLAPLIVAGGILLEPREG